MKQKQTILIGLCQQHDSDLSPTHVHILLQWQEGSIHQWSMLSKHTKGFISNLSVCVCGRVSNNTSSSALQCRTPLLFFAEFLWAIVFWSAISFHQHEMDSQISLVIFNKKPWDAQQKSAPPWHMWLQPACPRRCPAIATVCWLRRGLWGYESIWNWFWVVPKHRILEGYYKYYITTKYITKNCRFPTF